MQIIADETGLGGQKKVERRAENVTWLLSGKKSYVSGFPYATKKNFPARFTLFPDR
jgi:hypothetical protein